MVQNCNQIKSKKSDSKKIEKPIIEDDRPKSRFMILSSSDEEGSNEPKSKKRPKKKLKKKKVQKLNLSDDEDEADSDEFSDEEEENNVVDEEEEEKYIDYDSDENEIIVVPKKDIKKVARNYVDEEAELSESDWGSADEDENELDEMEVNEADAEDIDEAQVKDQLEKMHMKQVLDEDQREVRLLQELLFEDGDLHSDGKGRERKFKWKNIARCQRPVLTYKILIRLKITKQSNPLRQLQSRRFAVVARKIVGRTHARLQSWTRRLRRQYKKRREEYKDFRRNWKTSRKMRDKGVQQRVLLLLLLVGVYAYRYAESCEVKNPNQVYKKIKSGSLTVSMKSDKITLKIQKNGKHSFFMIFFPRVHSRKGE
ncbi:unnamed protein product [Trichogramma brassicae]|uniref:Uncharacterized protein n=1 Tax=Trichogramma brassicae TaxID=86971 RepID=A0A6H5IWW7_9HYME|nr:unnamed protein product [Trichogramma brassicae]